MDHVRCFRPVDGHTARWTYAMDYVRDSRLIDGHVGRWTYAMDFVRDSGCYLPQRGSTHRICAPDLQPHCEPDL